MSDYPRRIEASNEGDGSPLVLGHEGLGDLHTPCDPTSTVHVLDWDGDGSAELVCSGNDVFVYRFVDALPDGTPVVDRGLRWGTMSRQPQRNENDEGLTGFILAVADFDGDGSTSAILCPRYYSQRPVVALSTIGGTPTSREGGRVVLLCREGEKVTCQRGAAAAMDWNDDGVTDLLVVETSHRGYYVDPETGVCPEDQRDRYRPDGRWIGPMPEAAFHLFRCTATEDVLEFVDIGAVDVSLPQHTMWASVVDPSQPQAGLLVATYYGRLFHLPLIETGDTPRFGELTELFTLHGAPFHRSTNFDISIGVSDVLEPGRFDLFCGDRSQAVAWCRRVGEEGGRPVYEEPRKIKQRNPHVANSFFSVPTVGDWRGTGVPDLLVGGVEGYILWYRTLSTDPLRFAPSERLRCGTTEIRRLAMPDPAAGRHWGSSQGPHDGDTGGYSNPVLADWDGDGLLDLVVSDMNGIYDWYPNWGTRTDPELGPPCRLCIEDGEPLFGPWRQQPGIGCFSGGPLPDIVIQDPDLDLALFRRAGAGDALALLRPGEKLRYEDGSTIKTHGIYTPSGGDGRGRTKIQIVDWDGDGRLDLLLGVGSQHGSPYRGSYVLFARNVGSNEQPLFQKPQVLLWDREGAPLEFWRHGVHMAAVDWDGDGCFGLIAGADQGRVWYWKPEHFGTPDDGDATPPLRPEGEQGLGRDD
ncbi:MAG: hypothetical protein VX733_15125 [Candidatus Latescibacterota bacterium]|nr:hypothetical protein [Candidatus Latescibacterota bacterium]